MRRLGRALSIEAMSIYHHFANKDDLLEGLFDLLRRDRAELLAQLLADTECDASWEATIRQYLRAFREIGRSYPEAFRLLTQKPLTTIETAAAEKTFMEAIVRSGVQGDNAIIAYRTILSFASGFVLLENEKIKPFYTTGSFDLEYEKGTDLILEGIERCLRSGSPASAAETSGAAGAKSRQAPDTRTKRVRAQG